MQPVKPTPLPHETGLLVALRRIRAGRVVAVGEELLTERGRPLPRMLIPYVVELFHHGHARLDDSDSESPEHPVVITEAGEQLLTELEASTGLPDPHAGQLPDIVRPPATPRGSQARLVRAFPDNVRARRFHRQALEQSSMRSSTPIAWLSLNLHSGGMDLTPGDTLLRRHGSVSIERLRRFPQLVRDLSPEQPDVIFLQEAMWFNHEGGELLHFLEHRLLDDGVGRYRGFLALAHLSPHHQVVLINTDRMIATHHWHGADADESDGRYGWVQVVVDRDDERTLWLKSVHLDPQDPNVRLAEVIRMTAALEDGQRAIMAGDFNSDSDTDPDTRALNYLLGTGWTCKAIALNNTTPTTTPRYRRGGSLTLDRCLTRGAIALHSMWVDTSDAEYSDHRALGGVVSIVGAGAAA